MQHVLAHERFKLNPIAAISNHIVSLAREGSQASASRETNKDKATRIKPPTPAREREKSAAHAVGVSQSTASNARAIGANASRMKTSSVGRRRESAHKAGKSRHRSD